MTLTTDIRLLHAAVIYLDSMLIYKLAWSASLYSDHCPLCIHSLYVRRLCSNQSPWGIHRLYVRRAGIASIESTNTDTDEENSFGSISSFSTADECSNLVLIETWVSFHGVGDSWRERHDARLLRLFLTRRERNGVEAVISFGPQTMSVYCQIFSCACLFHIVGDY